MKKYLILMTIQLFASAAMAYEAHEWGTFTSLVGSNGVTQTGLYHEDEHLPDFVHGFGEVQNIFVPFPPPGECGFNFKTCFSPAVLENNIVSQKMETPVIYFYGDQAQRVTVDVDFPQGIITETFPAPYSSSPRPSDNLVIANGKAQFIVDLLQNSALEPPYVEEGNIYSHARNVDSLKVQSGSEVEKFIFYRGLGRYNPRMSISSQGESVMAFSRQGETPQAFYLVYSEEGGEAQILPLLDPGIDPGIMKDVLYYHEVSLGYDFFTVPDQTIRDFKAGKFRKLPKGEEAHAVLVRALDKAGLNFDEAQAMVNTWKNGYFKTPGLRILSVLPRNEVDSVLPIKMSPAPENLERVFVARIEVMLEKEELDLVAQIIKEKLNFDIQSLGRLAEPRLRRIREVYQQQHIMSQPVIPNFEYGLFSVFDELVRQSFLEESSPLVVE